MGRYARRAAPYVAFIGVGWFGMMAIKLHDSHAMAIITLGAACGAAAFAQWFWPTTN